MTSTTEWRAVLDGVDDPVFVLDQMGRIVLANRRAVECTATPEAEIVGAHLWELPELAAHEEAFASHLSALGRGGPTQPVATELEAPHGGRRVVTWQSRPLETEGAKHAVVTGHDVTSRQRAEAALREREERYRDAFERSDTIWWEIDLATGEGVWPDAASAFYGLDPERRSLDAWWSVLHPEDRERDARLLERMIAERWSTFETENRVRHPEKGLRWLRTQGRIVYASDGTPARLVGIDTDVTEHRRALDALRESERGFRTLADSLPQIVWTARADGTVDYYNRRWTEFSGITQTGGEGWGWRPVVHEDDDAATVEAWLDAVRHSAPYAIQHRIRRHDGAFRWHVSRALPTIDDEGRVVKWYGTATDVHDQKEATLGLQRRTVQQTAVAELGIAALQTPDLPTVLEAALKRVADVLDCDFCKVLRLRRERRPPDFVLEAAIGGPPEWVGTRSVGVGAESQAGLTLASNEPVLVADLPRETRFRGPRLLHELGIVSGISVVIHGNDAPYGVLGAHATVRRDFDAADAAFMQAVANVIAGAVKRQQADAALEQRLHRLAALHAIDNAITDATGMEETLAVIVDQVQAQLGVDAVAVLTYSDELQTLEFAAGVGFHSDGIRATRLRLGEGPAGAAALERRTHHATWAPGHGPSCPRKPLLDTEGFVSQWCVPLIAQGELEGVLEVFQRAPVTFSPDPHWRDFLGTLAIQTAIAINSSRLFANLQATNAKLRLAYDATIEGWARALDLKDHRTEGHSRRVTDLTVRLARRMGVSDDELVHVRRGALLHDIGKMGIPDRILLKEGALDPDEWEVMRSHPSQAYELLMPIEFLRDTLDIPYCHHERWDGSGYPRGLSGEQIPLAARIFSVVDVYDALTSDRPYWSAWPRERALAHVRDEAGRHFDPSVVAAFLEMMG